MLALNNCSVNLRYSHKDFSLGIIDHRRLQDLPEYNVNYHKLTCAGAQKVAVQDGFQYLSTTTTNTQ
jgi:hypothetical protein